MLMVTFEWLFLPISEIWIRMSLAKYMYRKTYKRLFYYVFVYSL